MEIRHKALYNKEKGRISLSLNPTLKHFTNFMNLMNFMNYLVVSFRL